VGSLAPLAAELASRLPGRVETDAPFGAVTTWRVGGPAAVLVRVAAEADLAVLAAAVPRDVPRVVLGRGSNVLVADAGYEGVVIALGPAFESIAVDDTTVTAGGATPLPVLARQCAVAGRAGLGFYVGIPGSVGGAVRMNAGGHGRETVEVLVDATVVDLGGRGESSVRPCAALELGYRRSALTDDDVVVSATFRVTAGDPEQLRDELRDVVRWRTEHQPGGANAGSVFRNPPDDAAARLIDREVGLRGLRVGGAVVSEKHANFIQAEVGATAADVHQLIELVRDRVEAATGVRLEPEVRRIGFDEDP
jgi:UDP-N-acetylmuramate dehydrogenase